MAAAGVVQEDSHHDSPNSGKAIMHFQALQSRITVVCFVVGAAFMALLAVMQSSVSALLAFTALFTHQSRMFINCYYGHGPLQGSKAKPEMQATAGPEGSTEDLYL